jgi:serine/threonine-protein kinase
VTGVVPFVKETTMGTLAARVGQPLPHNDLLGPLDDVLARAAAPDVASRLDAAGLAARLGALAAALPTPSALPLIMPKIETSAPIAGFRAPGVSELTDSGVTVAGIAGAAAAAAALGDGTAIAPGLAAAGTPIGTKAGPGELFDAEPGANPNDPTTSKRKRKRAAILSTGGPSEPYKPKPSKKWWWIGGAVALALILAAGLIVAFGTDVLTPSHPTPTVVNLPVAQAKAAVDKVHMTLKEGAPVTSITVAAGDVISQAPKPGVSQKEGSTVNVVLSSGKPDVTVPSLSGMTCAQATAALQAAHFVPMCANPTYSDTVPTSVLVGWSYGASPNPVKAPYGATITLVPSEGHAPVAVPNIPTSYSFAQAQAALQAVGLTATQNNESSTTVPSGQVISTSPASGQPAGYGSAVAVNVSTGPPTTTVPNVIGDTVAQATTALQAQGLSVSGVSGSPSNMVTGTQPSVGSTVPTSSAVQIFTH